MRLLTLFKAAPSLRDATIGHEVNATKSLRIPGPIYLSPIEVA